jgi:hypothetical protein
MCEAITAVRKCKELDAGEWRESLDKDNKRRKNNIQSNLWSIC